MRIKDSIISLIGLKCSLIDYKSVDFIQLTAFVVCSYIQIMILMW